MAPDTSHGTDIWSVISRTFNLVRAGKSQDAIGELSSLLKDGLFVDLAIQRAQILCAVGQADKAVRSLNETLVKLQPASHLILNAIGFARVDAGHPQDGLRNFETVLRVAHHLRPHQINHEEQAMSVLGRTLALVNLNQTPAARDMVDRYSAHKQYAHCTAFKIAQAAVNRRIASGTSIHVLGEITSTLDGDPWLKHRARHELAADYETIRDWANARDVYNRCLNFVPEDPKAKAGLARAENRLAA